MSDINRSQASSRETQFNVVLTYNTALSSPRDAVDLAFTAVSDRSGVYVEVFEEGIEAAVSEGELLNEQEHPKFPYDTVNPVSLIDPPGSFSNCNVVFTYSTIATSPNQALSMALDAIDGQCGAFVEVFSDGHEHSVIEDEIIEFFPDPAALKI